MAVFFNNNIYIDFQGIAVNEHTYFLQRGYFLELSLVNSIDSTVYDTKTIDLPSFYFLDTKYDRTVERTRCYDIDWNDGALALLHLYWVRFYVEETVTVPTNHYRIKIRYTKKAQSTAPGSTTKAFGPTVYDHYIWSNKSAEQLNDDKTVFLRNNT